MKKKRRSWKKWTLIVVVVLVILGVAGSILKPSDDSIAVTMKTVERGDLTSKVTGTGKVHPTVQVRISSEVAGEIVELPVKDGDPVQKGDLLVRVNPDTLEAQVKQQEASLASARATSAQSYAQKIQSERELRRIEGLHAKGFATEDELDQARTEVEVRSASYEASQHQIQRQEMQLQEARDALSKATTFSPLDGTVVSLNSELGDRVVGTGQFEGTEIMRVANLGTMEVRVDVSEADIVNIEIGQKASIEIDALPDETFDGKVTEIANSAITTNSRSQDELTTFEVKIEFVDPDPRLRPGMSATADIETKTVTDVVKAPLQSVVVRPAGEFRKDKPEAKAEKEPSEARGEGGMSGRGPRGEGEERLRAVFVVKDDNTVELRKVETGIADNRDIEVLSGLSAGEKIVTGSYRALTRDLKNGDPVREEERKKGERPGREG